MEFILFQYVLLLPNYICTDAISKQSPSVVPGKDMDCCWDGVVGVVGMHNSTWDRTLLEKEKPEKVLEFETIWYVKLQEP